MEEGLDTGPVAACRSTPIGDQDTAGTLAARLSRMGAELLLETLPVIAAGQVSLQVQDHARATLAPMLTKDDGLLDFQQPAPLVSAHARGVDPWPGAFAWLGDEPMKLFGPTVVPGQGEPGSVLGIVGPGLSIACGEGAVAFAELQLAGRKRLPAAAVLAGRPIAPGTRLRGKV
jgi:methionyl-tRNA formyltransferase